jgi:DNA-binding response OmpR family regulator
MNSVQIDGDASRALALAVAVVEDDRLLREEISIHLVAHGFTVHAVGSALALDDIAQRAPIGLYVIDLNLPGETGLSLAARLRKSRPEAGIVILTARVALSDRLAAYREGGADVYLSKPVAPDELVLVLRGLGRRIRRASEIDDWKLSLRERTLTGPLPGQHFRLTHREKALLIALAQARDNTLESAALCDLFADDDESGSMNKHALEELVARLRRKFKVVQPEGAEPAIKSVWGYGYQLCVPIMLG